MTNTSSAPSTALNSSRLRVFVKFPSDGTRSTEWLDLATEFVLDSYDDNDGAHTANGSLSFDNSLSATNYVTLGTVGIGNNEYIGLRVEADTSWTGYIDSITVTFGAGTGTISAIPDLDDIDCNSDGTDSNLSFGSSKSITGYTNVAASAGLASAVDINGLYETDSDSNNLRRSVFALDTNIEGDLNEDVSANSNGSHVNHTANAFSDANSGSLKLEVNGSVVHTVEITGSYNLVGTGVPGSGTGTSVNSNGSGFINLSTWEAAEYNNGVPDYTEIYRTGKYRVHTADQRNGWNYARVVHTVGGSDRETNYVEWVNDDNSDALAAAGNSITFSGGPTTTIKLSGVEYFQSASLDYKVRVSNAYKYVYDTNQITFGASTGGPSNSGASFSLASQAKPSINTGAGEDHTKVLHLTASNNLTADYMVNGTATANVNVTHPLKSNISSGGSTTVSGILMYNLPDTSTATSETFQRETYRLQSGSFNAQSDVTGGSLDWDSAIHMSGSGGHADGLQFMQGVLKAPTLDFRMANGPSPSNPDYSTLPNGLRTLYRKYRNTYKHMQTYVLYVLQNTIYCLTP